MTMTPEEIAKQKAKLSKLLNMTVENGCTEDEQESAMRMAAGIAARIGISLDSVTPAGATTAQRKAIRKGLNQEFKIHQVLAAQAAASLYGCEVYTYSGGKGGLFFIGREENVELTEQTMFWLMRQVELLYKEHLPKGLSQSARAEYRKTFKAACAHRVYQRSLQLMREMRTQDDIARHTTGQNALVVQGYFDQLKQENEDYFKPTAEQEARWAEQQRLRDEREEARRNALTPVEREAEDRLKAREAAKAAKRKGPRIRTRSLPVGNGTEAGSLAGNRVKLRNEVK